MTAQKTPLSRTLTTYVDGMIRKEIQKLGKALPCQVVDIDATGTIVTVSFQLSDAQLPQVQLPVAGAEYIRYPIQKGSLGVTFPADTYLGQVTGLGSGAASLTRRANLSTLVFFPVGNKNWTATDDAQAVVIYGPNGVILRDTNKKSTLTLTPSDITENAQTQIVQEVGASTSRKVTSSQITDAASSEISLTVGSVSLTINGSEIVLSAGGITATLSAAGLVVTGPVTGDLLTGTGLTITGTGTASIGGTLTASDATIAGKTFSTHKHSGVTTGGSDTGPPA